jgi:integrase
VFAREGDAKAHLATVEHHKGAGTYIDAQLGRQRFRDYAAEWAAAQDWKASTRRDTWPKMLKRLDPEIGGLRLADIDRLTLERLRATLADRYARSVVEGTMHRAMAILRHAYANGVIGRDPTTGVKAAPKRRADDTSGKVTPERVPTRAEALAILAATPEGYRAAIALGLAGLRIDEVLGMEWSKIDLVGRRVTVDQQTDGYAVTTPKCEKVRTITVPELVAVQLRRHRRDHATDRWLFPGGGVEGSMHRVRFYKLAWGPALRAAGLEGRFTFHGLRHFAASTLLA